MEPYYDLIKDLNIFQTLIIISSFWFFYNRIDKKIQRMEVKIDSDIKMQSARIDKQNERSDKLYEMFIQMQKDNHDLINRFLIKEKTNT